MDPWLSTTDELELLEYIRGKVSRELADIDERIARLKSRGIQTFGGTWFPDNQDKERY